MTAGNNIFFSAAFKSGKFEFSNECTYMVALISKLEKISITQCLINLNYPMDMVNRRKTNFYEQTLDCRNINKYKSKYNKYLNAKTKIENLPVKKLYSKIKNKTLSTMQFSVIVDTIYNSFKEDDIVCYQTTWKLIFGMLEQSNEKIKKAIENIHPSNYDTELKKIINDFTLEKLLSCLNVETIHDLCMLDLNLISILFDRNLESLVNSLQQLSMSKEDIYNNLVEELEQKLKIKEIDYDVLSKRYGFFGEIQTLEEIAQQYGLTRERIRQIEKRAERMVLAFEQSIYLYFNTLLREMLDNNKYIEEFQLKQLYNQKLIGFTKLFATLYRGEIEYSYKYKIFYEKGSLEYIVEEILSNFPMLLTTSAYNEKNEFEKRVIDEFYSVRKNGKHMRIGFTDGIIYSSIVDELFPNGFSATEENMKKVNNQLVEKYEMEPVTAHALSATLSRMDYCYIDKGTIINRKFAAVLDEGTIKEIINYISNSGETLYYTTIFEVFKDKLLASGIDNRYYLKGIIDSHLPENCVTKRDYISTGDSFKSSYDMVLDVVNQAEGVFGLEMLRNKFPGVEDYVFMNCIYYESNILNHSYGRKYFNVNKLAISNEFIETSIKEIEFLFKTLNTDVITSDKIYSRLKIMHKELIKTIPIIDNHFALFSLYSYIFKDKYNFKRPYIYKGDIDVTHDLLINNYVDTLPWFNMSKVSSYTDKMNMRKVNSYLELMIAKSDAYVQINIDTCVKKESLNIDSTILGKIKHEINYYLDSFGVISSEKLTILNYLPKIKYGWNKYLLVGIIRSYLSNDYDIEYTDSMYTKTEFKIRRI